MTNTEYLLSSKTVQVVVQISYFWEVCMAAVYKWPNAMALISCRKANFQLMMGELKAQSPNLISSSHLSEVRNLF